MTPTGVSYIRVVSQTDSDDTIEPFGGFTRKRVSALILGVHLAHVLFNGHHVGGTRWSEGGSGAWGVRSRSELHNSQGFYTSDCEEKWDAGSHFVLHSVEGKKGENLPKKECKRESLRRPT